MTLFHDPNSKASRPLKVLLWKPKLRSVQPELYPASLLPFLKMAFTGGALKQQRISEHLEMGDSQPAVVVSTEPLTIAAYSDELDAVALLSLPQTLVHEYGLEPGSRLVSSNVYIQKPASDLVSGEGHMGRYGDFIPLIADFLTKNTTKVEARKQEITEEEWAYVARLGAEAVDRGVTPRDGRPLPSYERASA